MDNRLNRAEKQVKDLSFLLALPKETVVEGIVKYLEKPGTGSILGEITIPAHIHLTFIKFDYEGRFISQLKGITIKNLNEKNDLNIPIGVYEVVKGMKLY